MSGFCFLAGCGSGEAASRAEKGAGSVGLALVFPGDVVLQSASYTITGPGGYSKAGSVDLSASTKLSVTIGGIPSGSGYRITFNATATDAATTCTGSATFDVTAGTTTPVDVSVDCHQPATAGNVRVNGALDVCPVVDGVSALPNAVFLGGSVALTAQAHDSDGGPVALAYQWSASSGVLDGTGANAKTFTCTAPGDATVTVTVSDGDTSCDASQSVTVSCSEDPSGTFYTTKTPYQQKQDPSTYEPPPAGFSTVFVETVTRHGSRGLSSVKYDAAAYNMWRQASNDGALTALGATLGADITKIMKANALLGFGVAGITTPGYGNLTQLGINEQKQLAARLLARQASYFAGVATTAGSAEPRSIRVISSGVDRAVDSAAFFSQSLTATSPALAPLITQPPAPVGYPANAPVVQPAGTNRFLLYFHKLAAKTDLVTNTTDPYYQTYQDSLAFQAYATNTDLTTKVNGILSDPSAAAAARAVLEALFTEDFVNKIDNQTYTFANTGTYSFTSDDGVYSATVTGDGKTKVQSLTDAASMLYNLYVIAPAMTNEVSVDFTRYVPSVQARTLAYLQDAQDFYQMGPGIQEANPITYKMAQALEDDFFNEIDAISHGDLSHGATLRFTHAEIMCPFASILGLSGAFTPMPKALTYTYENNGWRGELVAPMAANVQWDVYRDTNGTLLVHMLYNEKETDFKPSCDGARYAPGSHYYSYGTLAACYGHTIH